MPTACIAVVPPPRSESILGVDVKSPPPIRLILGRQSEAVRKTNPLPTALHERPDVAMTVARRIRHHRPVVLAEARQRLGRRQPRDFSVRKNFAAAFIGACVARCYAVDKPEIFVFNIFRRSSQAQSFFTHFSSWCDRNAKKGMRRGGGGGSVKSALRPHTDV